MLRKVATAPRPTFPRMRTLLALGFGVSLPFLTHGQTGSVGGGNLNPGVVTHAAAMEEFQDRKVGLSLHWGPSSLGGEEINWSRGKQISQSRYDSFYLDFNPTRFDADAWMELAKSRLAWAFLPGPGP